MTTAVLSVPREERANHARWFWGFLAVSLAVHVAFLLHARWERHSDVFDSARAVMTVQMVEVLPAPPEPVVEPAPAPEPVAAASTDRSKATMADTNELFPVNGTCG